MNNPKGGKLAPLISVFTAATILSYYQSETRDE